MSNDNVRQGPQTTSSNLATAVRWADTLASQIHIRSTWQVNDVRPEAQYYRGTSIIATNHDKASLQSFVLVKAQGSNHRPSFGRVLEILEPVNLKVNLSTSDQTTLIVVEDFIIHSTLHCELYVPIISSSTLQNQFPGGHSVLTPAVCGYL